MQIRTVTVGAREEDLGVVAKAAQLARRRLEEAGYVVQTTRLALSSSGSNRCGDMATIAQGVEQQALDAGFDYMSIGRLDPDRQEHVAEALAATSAVFASIRIGGRDGEVGFAGIRAAARAMTQLVADTPQGLGNLRLAALAGVGPRTPFFPAAYHDGGEPWLAVGPEASALAVAATAPLTYDAGSLFGKETARANASTSLTNAIEQHDRCISSALGTIEAETGVFFVGCDWSLAPHPDPARSIGAAIEALSGVPFGRWGTLAAVRMLTDSIRNAKVRQLGFSGIMLPVLEDTVLARRAQEHCYTLRDLLAFSTVCGTGLDTIPLPGDVTAEQIAPVLWEVASLSGALRKPLTTRLMPMPGLQAGDIAEFDFTDMPELGGYFCPARVLALP